MSLNQLIRQSINLGENMAKIPFQMTREWLGQDQSNQSGTQNLMLTGVSLSENLVSIPFQLAREMVQDSRLNENIVMINNNEFPENPD